MAFYDLTVEEYAEFYYNLYPDRKPAGNSAIPIQAARIKQSQQTKNMGLPVQADEDNPVSDDEVDTDSFAPEVPSYIYKVRNPEAPLSLIPLDKISNRHDKEAKLFGVFCSEVQDRLNQCDSKLKEWQLITEDYNNRRLIPQLYDRLGNRSERSLRVWLVRYQENNHDMYALLHRGKNQQRGHKVTYIEQNYLLNKLLGPNKIKLGSAITSLKSAARLGLCESPTSVPTLKRWVKDWIASHPAEWAQARHGSKFVAEKIIKTILRDDSALNVGDVWVADGHTLAFDVIHPTTGKPVRMTLILILDWASRYPVGASLAMTEDSQHILTAFRNGFLNWGALPKYVYLDNGKAFKSKLFNEQWEKHDLSTELGGIFPRLNIGVAFAESYNAKAKVIERFFKTMQEQFERFMSTFRGASIDDKPATLMRNEKWAQKLFAGTPPTVEEAIQLIAFYIRYYYGESPHLGLNGRTPWQVFSSAPLPGDRLVDPSSLNFLMLIAERKRVRSEGIRLDHKLYWDRALVDQIGNPVIIRYDYNDARWILVYDQHDKFICQAEIRQTQHPFIQLAMDKPKAHKELAKEYNEIKKMQRDKEHNTKLIIKTSKDVVDELVKPLESVASSLLEDNPTFKNPPLIAAPDKSKSPEAEMERIEQLIMSEIPERQDDLDSIPTEPIAEIPTYEDEDIVPEGTLSETTSFEEMLQIIGIK
jgi:putative transposase